MRRNCWRARVICSSNSSGSDVTTGSCSTMPSSGNGTGPDTFSR